MTVKKFFTTEVFDASGGGEHRFLNEPDFHRTVPAEMSEFAFKANEVLRDFRRQWTETHQDSWACSLELDCIPVLSEGMVTGFLVVNESDGVSYDFTYPKQLDPKTEEPKQ